MYIFKPRFFFTSYESISKDMKKISGSLKRRQTVMDKQNFSKYLKQQTEKNGGLLKSIDRTAQYDKEFKEFLKKYQDKHKEYPNILDLSHYTRDQSLYNKNWQLRKEEIDMIEEFRKRKQQKETLQQYEQEQFIDKDEYSKNIKPKEEPAFKQDSLRDRKELQIHDEFMILLIDRGVTSLTTTLNRVNHFRYIIFMGNSNGVIGYGKGKGADFEEALNNAIMHAKKNLIAIPLDHWHTFPRPIKTQYNGLTMVMEPRIGFKCWGHPVLATMIGLTGIVHCRFHIRERNLNYYALIMAYFKLVTQNLTPRDLCEMKGIKIYRQNWGKPYFMKNIPQDAI